MEYRVINQKDDDFESICTCCENDIVLENLVSNGGTLQFRHLTYQADCIIVAEEGTTIIGFNSLNIDYDIGFYVNQIAVRKEYQQKGIGTTLISMGQELANKASLPVYAHVREYNIGSQKAFEKCGFEKDDTYRTEESFFYAYNQKSIGERKEK